MAGETLVTIVGNLASDPELRFIPSGVAVVNFTIASTPRIFDRQANEAKDGETLWMRCSAWREMAENIAESLTKGMRVVAQGRLSQRSWDDPKTGEKRSSIELQIEAIGPDLRFAKAQVTRAPRSGGSGFGQGGGQGGQGGNSGGFQSGGAQASDPWASAGPASSGGSFQGEPPF
jgi:single-strand DNA-binding protein